MMSEDFYSATINRAVVMVIPKKLYYDWDKAVFLSAQATQFRIWATQTLKEGADAEAVDRGSEGESVLNYDFK